MSTFGVKMIKDKLPHSATHIRETKAVSSLFAIVIYRRQKGETITPRSIGQGPYGVSPGEKVYSRYIEPSFTLC